MLRCGSHAMIYAELTTRSMCFYRSVLTCNVLCATAFPNEASLGSAKVEVAGLRLGCQATLGWIGLWV